MILIFEWNDNFSNLGRLSKGVKRISLEHMPGIYADCLHAEEGIRFKKNELMYMKPIKLFRYNQYYE